MDVFLNLSRAQEVGCYAYGLYEAEVCYFKDLGFYSKILEPQEGFYFEQALSATLTEE